MIATLALRELRSMFLSPLAWAMLAVVQLILAWFFFLSLEYFSDIQAQLGMMEGAPGITQIVVAPLFATTSVVLLFVVPLLTMRLISGERANNTLSLLFSAPISMTEIIIGKFLGALGFLCILLILVAAMPLALLSGATLDFGTYFCGLLGLFFVLASLCAVGLFISTMTAHPAVAAMSSFGAMLLLWILDFSSSVGEGSELFSYLSMLSHFQPMLEGLFNSRDILYFLIFISLFLGLSIRHLDAQRLQDK